MNASRVAKLENVFLAAFSVADTKFRCRVDACDGHNASYADADAAEKNFSAFTTPAESPQCQMLE